MIYKAFFTLILIWSLQQLCEIGKTSNITSFLRIRKLRLSGIERLFWDYIGINDEIGNQDLSL